MRFVSANLNPDPELGDIWSHVLFVAGARDKYRRVGIWSDVGNLSLPVIKVPEVLN